MISETEILALRSRIAELEDKVEFLYKRLQIAYGDPNATDPRIVDALRRGNLIEAIKVYREIYNVGLAEAKQAVEQIQRSI